jgi:RNA polymerase primary sigma factor
MTAVKSKKEMNTEADAFMMYLRDVEKIPLLSKEEEAKTARLAAQGNKAAREKLINSNLRFVISIAKRYQGHGLGFQDIISEGNIGLMKAVDNFDAELGYRFITYAVWWIRQAIVKAVHQKGRMIRLPSKKIHDIKMIDKARQMMYTENGSGDADICDAAAFLNMTQECAEELVMAGQEVMSLDDMIVNCDSALTIKDTIEDECTCAPDIQATNTLLRDNLNEALGRLEKRTADIIRCRYGLDDSAPMTLSELSDRFNLTRERLRQIEKLALLKLQLMSRDTSLYSYLAS